MIAVAFGIPGVGKSTVLSRVVESLGLTNLNVGTIMTELAIEKEMIKNRDELRKLELSDQHKLQEMMYLKEVEIINGAPNKNYLIETHAVVKTNQGFFPGLRPKFFEVITPDVFVVIEAKAEDIVSRRQADQSRERKDDLSVEDVQLHLDLTRMYASSFSALSGANLIIVENKQGLIEETSETLTKQLQDFIR